MALDRDAVRDVALVGEGRTATSHINSALGAFLWVQTDEFDYRTTSRGRMPCFDEAGYPRDGNGIRFSMRGVWSGGRDFEWSRAAEVIRSQLEDLVGIDYVIRNL